jgi:hypothetical protein
MIKITPKEKALQLFKEFRCLIIDSDVEGVNNEIATVCALLHIREMRKEFDHYFGGNPNEEVRPYDLSGKEFWNETEKELKSLHKSNYQ